MENLLNSNSLVIAEKSLDALWLRQQVISNNIANVDTPQYKCQNVTFEDILNSVLSKSVSGNELQQKLASIEPKIASDTTSELREDGNNVDIDEQNIELTRVQLQYQCMSRLISDELSRISYAIKGGA